MTEGDGNFPDLHARQNSPMDPSTFSLSTHKAWDLPQYIFPVVISNELVWIHGMMLSQQ